VKSKHTGAGFKPLNPGKLFSQRLDKIRLLELIPVDDIANAIIAAYTFISAYGMSYLSSRLFNQAISPSNKKHR
jgi:hypothetical protein